MVNDQGFAEPHDASATLDQCFCTSRSSCEIDVEFGRVKRIILNSGIIHIERITPLNHHW